MKISFNNIINFRNREQINPNIGTISYSTTDYGQLLEKAQNDEFQQSNLFDSMEDILKKCKIKFPEETKNFYVNMAAGSTYLVAFEQLQNLDKSKYQRFSFANFNSVFSKRFTGTAQEAIFDSLEKAHIDTKSDMEKIVHIFNNSIIKYQKTCEYGLMFIDLYGLFKKPEDIYNYLTILIEEYKQSLGNLENFKGVEIVDFLKKINIQSDKQFFEETFKHQAPNFNNFKSLEDRLACVKYIQADYEDKKKLFSIATSINPVFEKISSNFERFYSEYADIIDYIYNNDADSLGVNLFLFLNLHQELKELTIATKKTFLPMLNLNTAEGKLEYLNFLNYAGFTTKEINILCKPSYIQDVEPLDTILNKKDILSDMLNTMYTRGEKIDNQEEEMLNNIYYRYPQALNAIYKNKHQEKFEEYAFSLLDILTTFNIKDDKELNNFICSFEKSISGSAKGQKPRKNSIITGEQIEDMIYLMNFLDEDIYNKYKKDKHYPIKAELVKKEKIFQKNKQAIEEEIIKSGAKSLCHSALSLFTKNYDLFKTCLNPRTFTTKAIERYKTELQENHTLIANKVYLKSVFEDEDSLNKFLTLNEINLDDSEDLYSLRCVNMLKTVLKNCSLEEARKKTKNLVDNNFFLDAKEGLIRFMNSKTPEELETVLNIIIDNHITSLKEINTILNQYKSKNGDISNFLKEYKKQDYNDFNTFVNKLREIQKQFDTLGIQATVNNDNIAQINLNSLKNTKITKAKAMSIAKQILNPKDHYNFILGLKHAKTCSHPPHELNNIFKELYYGINGQYKSAYTNIMREFNLSEDEIKNINNLYLRGEGAIIKKHLSNELQDLLNYLNSDSLANIGFINGQEINISLHAKMRLLERFVLDDNQNFDLEKAIQKSNAILKLIYTKTPDDIGKSTQEDTCFTAYYNCENYQIKAVFNKNGELATLVKIS